jgi:hypothetical protein
MENVNLTKMFLLLVNNFKIKYDELLKAYNGGQCVMLLIKNVTTSKRYRYFEVTTLHNFNKGC